MTTILKKLTAPLILLMIVSCYNDKFDTIDNLSLVEDNNIELKQESNLKSELALAKVFAENKDVRKLIKREALKQFDYDYDVLYMLVKDKKMENNKTLEELLLKYMSKDDLLTLTQKIPTLTIFVPSLPGESFSAEKWDIEQEIPLVAYKNEENSILYVNSEGIVNAFEENEIPVFAIVAIKPSERVIVENTSTRNSNSSTVLQAENGMNFVFEFDEFNNITLPRLKPEHLQLLFLISSKKFMMQKSILIKTEFGKGIIFIIIFRLKMVRVYFKKTFPNAFILLNY
jgi:hypothetical protein